jgi:hypothetical protein
MQKFIDQGGSADAWNNRFKQAWPTPTMANGQRGPGAPATAGGPLSGPAAMPPSGNPKGGPPPASVQGGANPSWEQNFPTGSLGKLKANLFAGGAAPGTSGSLSNLPPTLGSALQNAMTKSSIGGFANTDAAAGGGSPRKQQFLAGGGTEDQWNMNPGKAPGGLNTAAAGNRFGQNPDGSWGSAGQAAAEGMTDVARKNADFGGDMMAMINANRARAGLPPL